MTKISQATRREMFYIIGLGLCDAEDITVKGLKIVKNAKKVYLEAYTSILTIGKEALASYKCLYISPKFLSARHIGAFRVTTGAISDQVREGQVFGHFQFLEVPDLRIS